jgi:hypothetical protein
MTTQPSLYNIINDFETNKDLIYLPGKPTIKTTRTVMPGAPGRISFTITQSKPPKVDTKKPKKYIPTDWPEEEELPPKKHK